MLTYGEDDFFNQQRYNEYNQPYEQEINLYPAASIHNDGSDGAKEGRRSN